MAEDIRHRLKQMPTDVWSIREKLALASSVMRSGDQNWVSVSRAIRPFGNPGRPDDWFSQKNCALQYSALLEKVETPRRKRGERDVADTPGDVIVRKLTIERIDELKRIIQDEKNKYRSLKKDLDSVRSGQMDHQIKEMYEKLQADKKAEEEAAARKAAEERTARESAKAALLRLKKPLIGNLAFNKKPLLLDHDDSTQESIFDEDTQDSNHSMASSVTTPGPSRATDVVVGCTATPTSPLLSHLLSNPPRLLGIQPSLTLPTRSTVESMDVGGSGFTLPAGSDVVVKQEPTAGTSQASSAAVPTPASISVVPSSTVDLDVGGRVTPDDSSQDTVTAAASVKDEKEIKKEEIDLLADPVPTPATDEEVTIRGTELVSSTAATPVPEVVSEPPTVMVTECVTTVDDDTGSNKVAAALKTPERRVSGAEMKEEKEADLVNDDDQPASKVSAAPSEELEEFTASPVSSVVSSDQVVVSAKPTPTSRSARGNRSKRASRRPSRAAQQAEESRDANECSSKLSDAETSDDEALSSHIHDESTSELFGSSMRRKIDLNESLPNSPASFTHSDTEDEKAHKIWKKSIMLVWRSIANHKNANTFMHKVNEDIAPGYLSIVHRPMDLTMIKKNIDSGVIRTTAEFQRDMMLMLINAMMYNHVAHDVHKMAVSMYTDVMIHIEHFVNTQMMVHSEPKLLRTLRRSDAHSDKEDDQRKRKISEPEAQPASGGKVKKRR